MQTIPASRSRFTLPLPLFTLLILLNLPPVLAQPAAPTGDDSAASTVAHSRWQVEATFVAGGGLDSRDVFVTEEGDDVTLSAGGGGGLQLGIRLQLSSLLLSSLGMEYVASSLSQPLKNATGSFDRLVIRAGLHYSIPLRTTGFINVGGGIGAYLEGLMDVDGSKVPDGAHNIYTYKPATGIHLAAEFTQPLPQLQWLNRRWSWAIGLRYTSVQYDLRKMTMDGINIPLELLPAQLEKDVDGIKGDSIDLTLSLLWSK